LAVYILNSDPSLRRGICSGFFILHNAVFALIVAFLTKSLCCIKVASGLFSCCSLTLNAIRQFEKATKFAKRAFHKEEKGKEVPFIFFNSLLNYCIRHYSNDKIEECFLAEESYFYYSKRIVRSTGCARPPTATGRGVLVEQRLSGLAKALAHFYLFCGKIGQNMDFV
jgi:hypothetical protein